MTALIVILPIGSLMIFEKISIVFYIRNEMSVFTFILIFMSKQKLAEYDYVISHTKCDVIRREMVPSYEKKIHLKLDRRLLLVVLLQGACLSLVPD